MSEKYYQLLISHHLSLNFGPFGYLCVGLCHLHGKQISPILKM